MKMVCIFLPIFPLAFISFSCKTGPANPLLGAATTGGGQTAQQASWSPPGFSSAELSAFLNAFPALDQRDLEISDDSPFGVPLATKNEGQIDMDLTTKVLGWAPPTPRWQPVVYTESSDQEGGPHEGPGDYERGFYALGHSSQPKFNLLVIVYWEAQTSQVTGVGTDAVWDYRVYTIGLKGEPIDCLDLFDGERIFSDQMPRLSQATAILARDLSLTVKRVYSSIPGQEEIQPGEPEVLHYSIDENGRITQGE